MADLDPHCAPQQVHAHWNGEYLPTEELWWDFGAFAARFKVKLQRLNESTPGELAWTDEMRQVVRDRFAWDCEKWDSRRPGCLS